MIDKRVMTPGSEAPPPEVMGVAKTSWGGRQCFSKPKKCIIKGKEITFQRRKIRVFFTFYVLRYKFFEIKTLKNVVLFLFKYLLGLNSNPGFKTLMPERTKRSTKLFVKLYCRAG